MEILYGIEGNYKNITDTVKNIVLTNKNFTIPSNDVERSILFGDHIFGTLKHLKINGKQYNNESIYLILDKTGELEIGQDLNISEKRVNWWNNVGKFLSSPNDRVNGLHKYISLNFGNIKEEFPEQLMAARFIKETDKFVLSK